MAGLNFLTYLQKGLVETVSLKQYYCDKGTKYLYHSRWMGIMKFQYPGLGIRGKTKTLRKTLIILL